MTPVLRDYQKYCVDRVIKQPNVGLLLDMGLGKTLIALTAIKRLRLEMFAVGKVLVIAPKMVAESTWHYEASRWDHTKALRVSLVTGSQANRIKALQTDADVYVLGKDNVAWLVSYLKNAWFFDMVILDESTMFKNSRSKRFRALAAVRPRIRRLVLLTGTPAPNKIEDLWAQIYLLDGGERLERYITHFRERYLDPDERGPNGVVYSYKPKPGAQDVILSKISDICLSLKAKDLIDLPEIVIDHVPVVLDAAARKNYDHLEKHYLLSLPEGEDIAATSASELSQKLQQLANGAVYDEMGDWHEVHRCKIAACVELIEALQARGKSVLLFYAFRHDKARLLTELKGYDVRSLENAQDIEDWNAGKIDVLLAHPASTGYGLNLQHGGHHIVWFGLTWNYELFVQANARLFRQGQTENVFVHMLIAQDTRDVDIVHALDRKENAQNYIMESLKERIRAWKSRST